MSKVTGLMLVAALACGALLGGCGGGYVLRGKVVEGSISAIVVTDREDPRLNELPVPTSTISLVLDPGRLNQEHVARGVSDLDGTFEIPVEKFGAGFLEYDFQITARHRGYEPAVREMRLPKKKKYLLIMLSPGKDRVPNPESYRDEVIRESKPYLE